MIICKRCRTTSGDDQEFCGKCGGFLPWDGEKVAAPAVAPEAAALPDPAIEAEPDAPVPPPPPPPAAEPEAERRPDPPPSAAGSQDEGPAEAAPHVGTEPESGAQAEAAGQVACPSCNRTNPPERNFCGRCGTTLTKAAPPPPPAERAAGTVTHALDVAASVGRADLAEKLGQTFARLEQTTITVALAGEFKTGKSTLVNALLGTTVCPADDLRATTAPIVVGHGAAASAQVFLAPSTDDRVGPDRILPIEVNEVPRYACEGPKARQVGLVRRIEVKVNRRLLESGLCLVDTPGFGGLASGLGELVLASLASTDAVLLVTDAFRELTEPEIDFLREASSRTKRAACVVTKIDIAPHWRTIVERDEAHLRAAGFDIPVFPVSSFLRLRAASRNDADMHKESRIPELLRYLANEVVPEARGAAAAGAANDVDRLSSQIAGQLAVEREVLHDPAVAERTRLAMTRAHQQATQLGGASAAWQTTLRDGMIDLSSDAPHELQERLRTVLEQANELVDGTDPRHDGEKVEAWVHRTVAHEVVAAFDFLDERARALAEQVAMHFAADVPPELSGGVAPSKAMAAVEFELHAADVPTRRGESALTAFRGTYSGAMMLGFAANIVALPLAMPVTLAAGLVLGGKSFRDDRRRQVEVRRAEMRRAIQRYVGRVAPIADKELRDALRLIERRMRDTFTNMAQELAVSASQAMASVERSAVLDEAARRARLQAVEKQLDEVGSLRDRAAALSGAG